MKFWTIQQLNVWELLNRKGYYHGTLEHVIDESFLSPYDWMRQQLANKTGNMKEYYPVWAWTHRPDLREGGHLPKGNRGVLIEFEIDESEVLISDFDLWHYVLNYWYLPISEEDGDKFEKELKDTGLSINKQKPLPEPYHSIVVNSWQRIFYLNWVEESITGKQEDKWFQAVFWNLRSDQIKKVKEFTAR